MVVTDAMREKVRRLCPAGQAPVNVVASVPDGLAKVTVANYLDD